MNTSYKETDKYIFFYGSCFSQWAIRNIKIDKTVYNCCEQFMMSEKAKLFGDHDTQKKIMLAYNPAVQKKLGRKVHGFVKEVWENIAQEVVYKANYAKFTQHDDLKIQLLETVDKIIVEASPFDCIWGIGIGLNNPGIEDPKNWRGTNWLGEAIMKVREKLKK